MAMQVVERRSRGFLCVNAHPEGCRLNVERQVEVIRGAVGKPLGGIDGALIIGSSTGYGLASRIAAAWGFGARTLGIALERPAEGRRTASAGFYNTAAFQQVARRDGLVAESLNLDAFSDETKREAFARIRRAIGPLDLIVYSIAAPRRVHPRTGEAQQSALKPIGAPFTGKTIDLDAERVHEVTIAPATESEVAATVAVMGGEDWQWWVEGLLAEGLLARGARAIAYSYSGPEITWPIYRNGTIGRAKQDLERTGRRLDALLRDRVGGRAWVSVNQAVVTQAAAAIPVVPLYVSLLLRVSEEKRITEGAIEQMLRLFRNHLAPGKAAETDDEGRVRLDDLEMRADVQQEIAARWPGIVTGNLRTATAFARFQTEFRNLFGFEVAGVDYTLPTETELSLTA